MDEVNKYFLIVVRDWDKISASTSSRCYKLLAFEYVVIGLMWWCGGFFLGGGGVGEGLVNLLFALFLTKIYSMDVAFGYEVSSACLLNPRICM